MTEVPSLAWVELTLLLVMNAPVVVFVVGLPSVQLAKAVLSVSWLKLTGPLGAVFFFNDTATTEIYTLSLHDALPISGVQLTLVVVACLRAVTTVISLEPLWLVSP